MLPRFCGVFAKSKSSLVISVYTPFYQADFGLPKLRTKKPADRRAFFSKSELFDQLHLLFLHKVPGLYLIQINTVGNASAKLIFSIPDYLIESDLLFLVN